MSNITVAEFKSWKRVESSVDDTVIQAAINAAEAAINSDCRRTIAPYAATATARSFVGHGEVVLEVWDIGTTSGLTVVNDGVTLSSASYQLEPLDGLTDSGLSVPWTRIRLTDTSVWAVALYGRANITITAKWGWPAASASALPYAYREAVMILAADVLDQRDIRNGVVAFAEFGALRVRENPMVSMLLNDLRHPSRRWGIG